IYMRQGRFAEALDAWRNTIRLAGSNAQREGGLGEAIAAEAGGVVTAEAAEAFQRAIALTPSDPKAQFFLAMAKAQEGRFAEAEDAWRSLAAALPGDSPWRGAVDAAIAQAEADGKA